MNPLVSRLAQDVDRDPDAALGEPVWGPTAWLGDLELRLGLPPVDVSAAARLQAYAARLAACLDRSPFYARSFDRDRYGTAATLLDWRDALIEAGWCGEPVSDAGPRIDALVAADSAPLDPLPLGFADRVARVELELAEATHALYERVRLLEPREVWPEAWRRVMDLLSGLGTRVDVIHSRPAAAVGDTDLARTQRLFAVPGLKDETCRWRGDGSLVHLRGRTSWELGESVAGFIRAHASRDVLMVRMGDVAPLEAAFQLQGLASQGCSSRSPLRSPLQILPLALSLIFAPRDPYRALELLTLPEGPLGPYASSKLAEAIGRAPGIGSREWVKAKAALAVPLDPSNPLHVIGAASSGQKIAAWFEGPSFDRASGAPREEVAAVIDRVRAWAQRRPQAIAGTNWAVLARLASDLGELVAADPGARLLPHELDQLSARVLSVGMSHAVTTEAAGRCHHVTTPSGVMRAHDVIVVWHAGHDPNAAHRGDPWRVKEVRALEAAGIRFADPQERTRLDGAAWRRAFALAGTTFVVATADSHLSSAQPSLPLWDEIVARSAARDSHIERVTLDATALLRGSHAHPSLPNDVAVFSPALALPDPRATWHVDAAPLRAALAGVTRFYPTAVENLLACPLRWVLESVLRIRPGRLTSVPDKTRLYGNLGHRLAEELYGRGILDAPRQVREAVEAMLDDLISREGGPLLMPGMTAEREQVRANLVRAMQSLAELIAASDMSVKGVETETIAPFPSGDGQPRELGGRLDLLLSNADGTEAIVDLKWGESRYREALAKGLALQLASYAETRRRETGAAQPLDAAYFALKTARGLSLQGSPFQNTRTFDGDSLESTWGRAERTIELVLALLAEGTVPASPNATGRDLFLAHHGIAAPPANHYDQRAEAACTYCQNGAICGRAWTGNS